jgi:signal transduction histidine kinase/CheY-like chemotaxis protein
VNWPELQIEHLALALMVSWLALGWFCWGCAQKPGVHGARRDTTWNWLAGAALIGSLQLVAWLALIQLRFESWPEWARTTLAAFTAVRGTTAAVAAWSWISRPVSRAAGWCAMLALALVAVAVEAVVPVVGAAGWVAVALAFFLKPVSGFNRRARIVCGAIFSVIALAEATTPDLTSLILRLPSEQPLQWGSMELLVLAVKTALALGLGLTLWVAEQPRRWRMLALVVATGTALFFIGWFNSRQRAAARAQAWRQLQQTAESIAVLMPTLRIDPTDLRRPEYIALVAALTAREQAATTQVHFWLWAVRDNMVVHVADVNSLGGSAGAPQTPPGYRYPQLHNFVLRSARGEHFESGPFFVAGERRMGLHTPIATGESHPTVWLQAAMPLAQWKNELSDSRASALIGVLCLAALGIFTLAGRTWLDATRRIHERAIEAAATARAKNEMVGLVSHELRTPLQVVLGHLELLHATPQPTGTQRALTIIDQQCRQLLGLINDTLDICALEAGRLTPRPVRFNPTTLAETAIHDFRPLALARGLTLELSIDPATPTLVEADLGRLRQIITNLLANAVKYTPAGYVRLHVAPDFERRHWLTFVVSDSGPGLPVPVIERLGEPFHPGPASQGTGLGLALVQRLAAHLDGEFSVVNSTVGGCVATVSVPAPGATADAPLFIVTPEVVGASATLNGLRLVLAEDNTLVREMIAGHLRSFGADVESVSDGAAALAACRTNTPDAVLLDLAMPGLDGRSVARALRESPSSSAGPKLIVGLSAETLNETEARAAGFDRFFVKPIALAELVALFAPHAPATSGAHPSDRLRELFAQEAPKLLSGLRSAVERHDRSEVTRLAHYLQGSAYALGDEPLHAACITLRKAFESPTAIVSVEQHLEAVEFHIQRLRSLTDSSAKPVAMT